MDPRERPYLTLTAVPDAMEPRRAIEVVAAASGIDAPTVRLRLAKPPPVIVGLIRGVAPGDAVAMLAQHGCDAFTNTLADLAALGPTLKIRTLRLSGDGLDVDLWGGTAEVIPREDVRVLVRASLRGEERTPTSPRPAMRSSLPNVFASVDAVLRLALDAPRWRSRVRTSDMLDVHTADGRVFQIDGDKFAYEVLGDLRGQGDRANMDRMCELLAHVCPNGIVDEYFPLWRPPPGYQRLRIPRLRGDRDDPGFAFYSRWAALLYRHAAGA